MRRGHPGSHTFTSPGNSRRPPVSCRHAFDSGRRRSFSAEGLSTGGLRGGGGGRYATPAAVRLPSAAGPTTGERLGSEGRPRKQAARSAT